MNNNRIVFGLIAFIVSAFAQQASASPAAVMRVIGKANPPIGHYEFRSAIMSSARPIRANARRPRWTPAR